MSMFEYLMVLVSIVMGLGITQVLRGLSKIARSRSAYSALTLWALLLFYLHVQVWWALWDLNEVAAWNQFYFTLIVLIPCSLFGATELLLPMGATPETNWRTHFFSVRRWFFALMIAFTVIATLETRILLGVPMSHPYRLMQFAILTLLAIGLVSGNQRIQPWLAGGAIGVAVSGQILFRLLPGLD
jgi:hypothetical protein